MARGVLAVLLVVSALPVRAQVDPVASRLLSEWVAAVRAHTPGVMDEAVVSIAAWDREELLIARPLIRSLVDSMGARWRSRPLRWRSLSQGEAAAVARLGSFSTTEASANDFFKRAALLHTDVVLLAQLFPASVPPPKPRSEQTFIEREEATGLVIARGPDGRFAGFERGNLNWEYARDLLDAVTPAPEGDATVALWYRTITATFAAAYSFGEATIHVEYARRLLPNDPGVLFGDAAIQETLASPRIQDYVRVTRLPNGQGFLFVTSEREHLEQAETLFRRAVQGDPTLAEARVRLARVLSQRGKHDEALSVLKQVPSHRDGVLTYYAHLIRGDAERALKRYEAAQASYRQALELFPTAQSARLALGHLARLRSDREGAINLLQPTLTAPARREDDDPWWEYHRGDGRNAETLFRQLRAPFLTAAPQ